MKKVLQFLCGRIFITGILLLVQLGWFTLFLMKLTRYSVLFSGFFGVLSILIVLYLIGSDDNPAYKIGWIILIMALPLLGGLLYLLMGNKRPSKPLKRQLIPAQQALEPTLRQDPEVQDALKQTDLRAEGLSRYLQSSGGWPVYRDSDVRYYPVGEAMYQDMLCALESAQHFIFLEYFIIQPGKMWDSILEILTRKAAEGVDVRLIYDDMGSLFLLPQSFPRDMERRGIRCLPFNPFIPVLSLIMNNRDHRKILVVDGHTAFNGGINLSDEYINETHPHGHWKDTGVRVHGPAAWNLTAMFLSMWHAFRKEDALEDVRRFFPQTFHPQPFSGEGFVQPFGDSPLDGEALAENVYIDILSQAKRYVYIFTPYLIIDDIMKTALCSAAKRGVDVRIVTPGVPDKKIVYRLTRSHYMPLLKAGVRIFEYAPGFIHAKSYVADDETAVIGTINMDYRSLYLHFECGTYLYRCPAVMDLKADALDTLAKSREVQLSRIHHTAVGALLDAVLRLVAPLF